MKIHRPLLNALFVALLCTSPVTPYASGQHTQGTLREDIREIRAELERLNLQIHDAQTPLTAEAIQMIARERFEAEQTGRGEATYSGPTMDELTPEGRARLNARAARQRSVASQEQAILQQAARLNAEDDHRAAQARARLEKKAQADIEAENARLRAEVARLRSPAMNEAAWLEKMRESYDAIFDQSMAEAEKLYPFMKDHNSPGAKRMKELDDLLERQNHVLFHSPRKPLALAQRVGEELGIKPLLR